MRIAGICSRRRAEILISEGKISVNGQIISELGTKVIPGKDIVEYEGRRIMEPEKLVYVLLNKPIRLCYNS